jgi:hypothetical protein
MAITMMKGIRDHRAYVSKNNYILRPAKSGGMLSAMLDSNDKETSGGSTNLSMLRNSLQNLKLNTKRGRKNQRTKRFVNL